MNERFKRAKERLENHEKGVQMQRDMAKRLGRVLPDEKVNIPKIGEWTINVEDNQKTTGIKNVEQTAKTNRDVISTPLKKAPKPINAKSTRVVRPFPSDIPLSKNQTTRKENPEFELIQGSFNPKNIVEAPYLIKSPVPVTEPLVNTGINGPKVRHPSGMTTTSIDSITRSKGKVQLQPLPPLKDESEDEDENNKETFLPLEMFDDSSYEEYPLDVLLQHPEAYSKYRELSGATYWTECTVVDYDPDTMLFTIEWDKTRRRKKVVRYNLRFAIEDEEKFRKRIEAAKRAARRYEYQYRFDSRIKQMPIEELPELSPENFLQIMDKTALKNISSESKYYSILQTLSEEVHQDFKYMNNELSFIYDLRHNALIPDRDAFLRLLPKPKPAPESGLVPHIEFNLMQKIEAFIRPQLYANSHILHGMQSIWGIFLDSMGLAFLTGGYNSEFLTLDEFVSKELQELKNTAKVFRGDIQETLEGVVTSTLNDESVANRETERHKYIKMVLLTTRMLHVTVLTVTITSLEQFSYIFTKYFEKEMQKIEIKASPESDQESNLNSKSSINTLNYDERCNMSSTKDINAQEEEEESHESKYSKVPPLIENNFPQFKIDLLFSDEKKLSFIPSKKTYKTQILSLLVQLENNINEIPCLNLPYLGIEPFNISYDDCCQLIHFEKENIDKTLENLFIHLEHFLEEYRFLEPTLILEVNSFIKDFDPNGERSLADYKKQLDEFFNVKNVVTLKMDSFYDIGAFRLSCASFKELTAYHASSLISSLLSRMKEMALNGIKELNEEFKTISEKLLMTPNNPEELSELKAFIDKVIASTNLREQKLDQIVQRFNFLEDYKYDISDEDCTSKYETLQMPQRLTKLINETDTKIQVERIRMIKELRGNQRKLEEDTVAVADLLPEFVSKYQDLEMTIDAVDRVNEIQQQLLALKEKSEIYSKHEKLFSFEPGPCRILMNLIEQFNPLNLLWNLANEWFSMSTTWLDTPFPQVKYEPMNAFIIGSNKKIVKLRKDLQPYKILIEKVLVPLQEQIDKFKQPLPLVGKLRHPGIKTKHWEQISQIVGFTVMPSMELNLQGFIDLHLERWNDQISQIASIAAQEYNIESALDQMDEELQKKAFLTKEFRDTGHFIITEIDDISSIIDDQLINTSTLLTSPFIAPVKKRALERLQFLNLSRNIIDEWVECQRSWLYLQPIFTGTSIQQKLHREARDWNSVDKTWTGIMTLTHNHPDFLNVMHRDSLFETLKHCNELLESITQGLNAYLETKRHAFPRFFFLSNDELITILSHTKDFDIIMKSMNKLFEYVKKLTVTEDTLLTEMVDDGELERVPLMNPVDGKTEEIEDWLNAFEEEMKNTIKNLIKDALAASNKKKREQWITEYPAQVILITNQILWTQQLTNCLRTQKLRSLKVVQTKFIEQLDQLTALIRKELTPSLRQLISCMLINEVHNRDIITNLISQSVTDIDSFKWVQQLRYYWEEENVIVRSINNSYEYSCEYAGNSTRLVITPLTDRCYQTLLAAFKQYLGGAPSGPAGTGKTETVRDCAKALGRPCVVYNCSEEVTPEQMSQFFAGLATSGTWSCFDEFNRINIEVLSVIAQQVRTIQNAIASAVETFVLDTRTLKLNSNAAISITMNPGYAGRTELPDNLKALFRPCAMMVPDFGFIAEILLFSGGFTSASALSVKLIALFDLCRKQLSNAHHYDWGLRAMKAILTTAGKSKRAHLDVEESLLLVNAIIDCTRPRLVSADLPLFDNIIHDVFPTFKDAKSPQVEFVESLKLAFQQLKLIPLNQSVAKCIELYESTLLRHGIMLVGGPMGGKSSCWKAIQISVSELYNKKVEGFKLPIHVESLNPKSISIPELYGLFDPVTSGWSDGVLSSKIRACSMSDPTEFKWIIADGPVDSLWIESMNSLLDDNKVLCLSNNERISLGNHVRMMFEVDDLSQASPATVSRCAMIFFDPSALSWEHITQSWIEKWKHYMITVDSSEDPQDQPDPNQKISNKFNIVLELLEKMMNEYLPKMIQFVQVDYKPEIGSNPLFLIKNMLKILDCFMDIIRKPKLRKSDDGESTIGEDPFSLDDKYKLYFSPFAHNHDVEFGYFEEDQLPLIFEKVFFFSLIWSFGASLGKDGRTTFDAFIKDIAEKQEAKSHFPSQLTVFDYYIDLQKISWLPWCDSSTSSPILVDKPIEQQLVPTNESASMMFLARLMVSHSHHVLFHGPESSKSLVIKMLMENILDSKKFDCRYLPLANCSTSSNLVKILRSFMQRRHGTYGPLPGKDLLVFLDNLGSVKPDFYGSQPPLELIRQYFDYGGWYDTSKVEFQTIVNTIVISAMAPQGGGFYGIPERLLRHYFYIHIPKLSNKSMSIIISSLLTHQLSHHSQPVKDLITPTTNALINIFDRCTQVLLPIPSKLHYVFSLRNMVRVIKGIMLAAPNDVNDDKSFIKLWYHELMKEFHDRFNSDNDRNWFIKALQDIMDKHFKIKFDELCPANTLLFNGFFDHSMAYKECTLSSDQLLNVCRDVLIDHNREASKPLDIVLFNEAVDHISSISRVLSMPRGHLMLVGVKSSGRKSLARLSMHISSMESFEIQITRTYGINEWRDNLKTLMKQCGVNDLPTTFLISDAQIVGNFQLEDISNLLINGEIPNLFEREEIDKIKADMVQAEMMTADEDPWKIFKSRVKSHLHIILVFSPYGTVFKESIMSFPALRTETTIDWFMPWSSDALDSVGYASIKRANLSNSSGDVNDDLIKSIVNVCVQVHKSVESASLVFHNETKRFTACTPSRYFELLSTFKYRYEEKIKDTNTLINNYEGGVEKIRSTRQQIQLLSEQLDKDIPVLQQKRKEVEEMLQDLQIKKGEVERNRQEVKAQSEIAEAEALEAAKTVKIAQEKFEAARPLLKAAQDAVDSMDKDSLVNVKTLKTIHPALRETFEAICIIFGRPPKKIDGNVPGVKIDDYWPETLQLVNDVQFIKKVKNYEIEKIPKEVIVKLKKYVGSNKKEREEKLQAVQKGYSAVANLYMWVCASYDYWFVFQEILPKRLEAEQAAAKFEASQKALETQQEHLRAVEAQLEALLNRVEEEKNNEQQLSDNVAHTQLRLHRAQKIMAGLEGETKRWTELAKHLKDNSIYIIGDSLLISACLTHLGPFSPVFRNKLISQWKEILSEEKIPFTKTFTIESYLGNDAMIRDWIAKGLSNDTHSIENGLIIQNSMSSFPLLIDPQFSGTKWLQMVEGDKLVILRFDQSDFVMRMRSCISTGIPVLIENVGLKLDPLIEPILSREYIISDGQKKIPLAGEYINYSDQFRMYLSTKYPNPIYSPEVCSQVTLINFTTTQEGLSDLLMNSLIEVEREDLDHKRIMLMEANAENTMKLKEIEQQILDIVSKAGQDLLDDDVAVDTLQSAQRTSANIEQQMAASEKTEKLINQFKHKFKHVSERAALLYFCASDFAVIDPMYQFSLKWYVNIFKQALVEADHPQDQNQLINSLNASIAFKFFQSVSFSLFSRHKLLFSFLLSTRILVSENHITMNELAFLLSPSQTKEANAHKDWLSDESWGLISALQEALPIFSSIKESISADESKWKTYALSNAGENEEIPPILHDNHPLKLTPFQRLIILRVFHLHRVREGIMKFITESLGKEFVTPPPLNLTKVFNDSSPTSPLIFIITPGIDPVDEIIAVAESMELGRYVKFYSLGRGRGQGAEELIQDSSERGFWVILQNCHLSLSWMPRLEHIIDHLDPAKVHNRFRLCLVTMSDDKFPIGILYQGSKLIYEIPKGLRENMLRIYSQFNPDEYEKELNDIEKKLIFHLAFFHSVVLERLQFGSIGWNIPYEFNPSDFAISMRHLKMFLVEAGINGVPFEALSYVIGELNYGGRVTDNWDRRLLLSLLNRFFSESINDPNFSFGFGYHPPKNFATATLPEIEQVLNSWPLVTAGEDVGLSPNASTITARNDAMRIFNSIIEIQPTLASAGGVSSEEQYIINFVETLIKDTPNQFNVFNFTRKFDMDDIVNTVLYHQILLFNELLTVIKDSLAKLQLGLKGMIIIDETMEHFSRQLIANKVPDLWLGKSYPTKLTLHSYFEDLKMRISFIDNWIQNERPIIFKLNAFYHPEEFLTAILQMYARKHSISFDSLVWTTKPIESTDIKESPEDGIYVEGLYLEGAKWDLTLNALTECGQKELISILPVMHLLPTNSFKNDKKRNPNGNIYECPLYRTQNRGTGALDLPNYIMTLHLPSGSSDPDHWIQRSVAAFITVQL